LNFDRTPASSSSGYLAARKRLQWQICASETIFAKSESDLFSWLFCSSLLELRIDILQIEAVC